MTYQDYSWQAQVADVSDSAEGGTTDMTLTGSDGKLVCGDECAVLPATDKQFLPTEVELVPSKKGPVVPVSALSSEADGSTYVQIVHDDKDERVAVTVVASQDGLAVVDGVQVGARVRVFGTGH